MNEIQVSKCCRDPGNLRWLKHEGKNTKFCRVCGRRFHRADFGMHGGVMILAECPWPIPKGQNWAQGKAEKVRGVRWESP